MNEKAIIAIIRALRTVEKSLRVIAFELTKLGMKTKEGGGWHASTIKVVLDNDIYTNVQEKPENWYGAECS